MKRVDIVSAVIFMMLGAFAIEEALRMPKFESFGPGGDFMPFWLGVVLIILALLLLLSALRSTELSSGEPLMPSPDARLRLVAILGGLVAYTLLLEVVGYLLCTFLFVGFLVAVLAQTSRLATLAIAAGSALVLTGLFSWLLGVPVPTGFLPL